MIAITISPGTKESTEAGSKPTSTVIYQELKSRQYPERKNTLHPSLTNPVVTNRTTSPSYFVQASNTISDEDVNDAGGKEKQTPWAFPESNTDISKKELILTRPTMITDYW